MAKRLLFYLIYIVFIILILYLGITHITELKNITKSTNNPYPSMFFNIFFSIILGLILGLPELISRRVRKGNWKIDWERFFIIGFPTLIITFSHIIYFSFIGKYVYKILVPWVYESYGIIISGIIFGYNIICSIKKS